MSLPFRQVHLDFHTSGLISGVGEAFDEKEFQRTLVDAAVDSITCFSLCHHGYSYHPTDVGTIHPSLGFDLLRKQIDAAHEVDIAVPIYISAGGNETAACDHPEWREITPPDVNPWGVRGNLEPGFHKLCFNTEYLDFLCRLTEEAVRRYPDADGVFFDIVLQRECCCSKCVADMLNSGLNPECSDDRKHFSREVMLKYYESVNNCVHNIDPEMPIFHNSGHLSLDRLDLLKYFSHLELESLPTGGWGYDNFPKTAAFARKTGLEFLGMTGKFHSSWGEFGGLKHPNALRYECAAMIASGAKCSIGDQLHPGGKLDKSTYEIIGKAYREVKEKEEYCRGAVNLADIAVVSSEACGSGKVDSDIGVSRILQEGHFLFDMIHPGMSLNSYKMVILPDDIAVAPELQDRLKKYVAEGGKVLACGESLNGLDLDYGAVAGETTGFTPTYILPREEFRPRFVSTPFVVYGSNIELTITDGESLGEVYYPYFNRGVGQFCSHSQTPGRSEPSGFSGGAMKDNVIALAHPLFSLYRQDGAVVVRQFLERLISRFLGPKITVTTNLPSTGRLTVTEDCTINRQIVHLLYAPTVKRGENMEIIEDLPGLTNVEFSLKIDQEVKSVTSVPDGTPVSFEIWNNQLQCKVDYFSCHKMIEIQLK